MRGGAKRGMRKRVKVRVPELGSKDVVGWARGRKRRRREEEEEDRMDGGENGWEDGGGRGSREPRNHDSRRDADADADADHRLLYSVLIGSSRLPTAIDTIGFLPCSFMILLSLPHPLPPP